MPKKSIEKIQYGDIFRVGSHIVSCGDATDAEFVKRVVGNRKIAAVICDPPYGVKVVESKEGFSKLKMPKKILNDDITDEPAYVAFTKLWLEAITPHLDRKNSFYIFNCDAMIFALREGMRDAGVKLSQLLVWVKSNAVIGRKNYLPAHELVAFGWRGVHAFHKSPDKSVLFCPKPAKNSLHPTQKPVDLIRRLILNSTKIGDVVFDNFAGSGTTGIAAEQTKRKAILIERDEEYVHTIIHRFEKTFGIKAELVEQTKAKT
jgi:DNA modification methylase